MRCYPEPDENNPDDPLVSIILYNYDGKCLGQCLDSIFNQGTVTNFEVILIDDATYDGSWGTALQYLDRYPTRITIQRNRWALGPAKNLIVGLKMARGRYCATLRHDQAFLPDYVKSCIRTMIADPCARFGSVCPKDDIPLPQPLNSPLELPVALPSVAGKPLVSILCYNFNYGRYLRECLESIFAQTYENIEICFSDNGSTDDSWAIALEFASKYPGRMYLTRNRKNFGPDVNFENCRRMKRGKYYINFCSDDVLHPEYVQRCVEALELYPNAGLAIVNRKIIDEQGRLRDEAPFYNQSCLIPGEEQAAVYMMAGINPSVSQIMYRCAIVENRTAVGGLVTRYYGTRILDFNISIDFDIVYLKDSLLLHRLHSQSDTSQADSSLLPVIGMYVLNHQFAELASVRKLHKVADRLPDSISKLASLSVRYSVRCLLADDEMTATRYFHLARAIDPQIVNDASWQQIRDYWSADPSTKEAILACLRASNNLATRTVSYDPPPGSKLIQY